MRKSFLLLVLLCCIPFVHAQYNYRYWIDGNVNIGGQGTTTEAGQAEFEIDRSGLSCGLHSLHLQAKNSEGVWSCAQSKYFFVTKQLAGSTGYYWFDKDFANKRAVETTGATVLDISGLGLGLHAVNYQVVADDGTPSSAASHFIYISQVQPKGVYCYIGIDDNEPTLHQLSSDDIVLDISGLSVGMHNLHVSLFDKSGEFIGEDNIEFEVLPKMLTITLKAAMGSFCSTDNVDFTDTPELKAYIASGWNTQTGKVLLSRIYDVPAGTGIVVKGDIGEYKVKCADESFAYYANLLFGTTESVVMKQEAGYSNYTLQNGDYGLGFYKKSDGASINAGKSYLHVPSRQVSDSKFVRFEFEDEPADAESELTGISDVDAANNANGAYYNLHGKKIQKPSKGIYIKNGKKVFMK